MDLAQQQASIQAGYRALIESRATLSLATLGPDGRADISYAPFVQDGQGRFCIFVSRLAAHTGNLLREPEASVMLIQPESEAGNLFARERLTLRCRAEEIHRHAADYEVILQLMEARFGPLIAQLRTLGDFHLLALVPHSGTYVVGFGRAYELDVVSGELRHIDADRLRVRSQQQAD
ncbi:HugZ family pyridoxamine 5'-phosphate oxidase [Marinobacterium rhizophilum]|uniref:Pyridoxamine 5'-phosphate oxidase family protein n=1 Tax=Marinobacterium rhizophilum TaxID=420402 RepID=A0ABY5HLW7_9GAMM|nr:pyridoxamine 5'-phosphate oxidase family protein [Marinobacterium rhizophilum]UTW11916.1 pyridoxamine 5'-phosphate oxidase family protein [Marinobacterium rhizophilum]